MSGLHLDFDTEWVKSSGTLVSSKNYDLTRSDKTFFNQRNAFTWL